MRKIKLTLGQVALVNDADYEKISEYNWYATRATTKWRQKFYATRKRPGDSKRRNIYMHRDIIAAPAGMQVDHINGNPLDNRRANIRIVTNRVNHQNRKKPVTSKYPGVCWSRYYGKWVAQICVNGKGKHLGYFRKEREAAEAYQAACNTL